MKANIETSLMVREPFAGLLDYMSNTALARSFLTTKESRMEGDGSACVDGTCTAA